jgi:hypothetical protein
MRAFQLFAPRKKTTPEIAAEETSPQPAGYPAAGGDNAFTRCSSIVPPFWLFMQPLASHSSHHRTYGMLKR